MCLKQSWNENGKQFCKATPGEDTKNSIKAFLWKHKAFQWHIIWSEATRLKGLTQVRQWGDRKANGGFLPTHTHIQSSWDKGKKGSSSSRFSSHRHWMTVLSANIYSWDETPLIQCEIFVCARACVSVCIYQVEGKWRVTQWYKDQQLKIMTGLSPINLQNV